jgi:hypothetical protein
MNANHAVRCLLRRLLVVSRFLCLYSDSVGHSPLSAQAGLCIM